MQFIIFILTLGIGVVCYPIAIQWLKQSNLKQQVSEYALEDFKNKAQTPTFGGVLFVVIPSVVVLIFTRSPYVLLAVGVYVAYGFIGLLDDYLIIKQGKNDGLSAKAKLLFQCILGIAFYGAFRALGGDNTILIPFMKTPIDLGIFYALFVVFLLAGSSNAVNLTDGMDGLAGGTTLIALGAFAIIANMELAMDLVYLIMAVSGALLAYLFYNKKPAQIFMGDAGSLPLGALLAVLAILLKIEVIFAVLAGVFVWETLCVIIQQVSVRTRKKKVFRYTPIHYSFTLNGWDERRVVWMFYGLSVICAILAIALMVIS